MATACSPISTHRFTGMDSRPSPIPVRDCRSHLQSRRSDRNAERCWHVAVPCILAGVSLIAGLLVGSQLPAVGLALLCIAGAGIYAAIGPMWALLTERIPAASAGLSLGFINAIANLGGIGGPYVVGALRDSAGSVLPGFLLLGGSLIIAGRLSILLRVDPASRQTGWMRRTHQPAR
jgi:nitrate/nitrite transporter NarK